MSEIKLNAVGDVWFGDHPVRIGHGVASVHKKHGPEFLFSRSASVLEGGDLNFCNLESVLSNAQRRGWWLPSIEMRGPPDGAAALKRAGFNIVSVANNHMMQHGVAAFQDTLARLADAGIGAAGVDGQNGTTQVVDQQIGDQRVCTVAFSMRPEQYYKGRPLYSHRESETQILDEIATVRATRPDQLICSLHWGTEYMETPQADQILFARRLVDSGVNVLLGHHPHVLQGWEYHNDGLILFSLGNFVFDLWPRDTRKSVVAHIGLRPGQRPSVRFTPIWINEDYQPTIATGASADEIDGDIRRLAQSIDGSLGADPGEYRREAMRSESKVRREGHAYFAKNLRRYSLNMLTQSVGRTLLRRLSGQ